MASFYANGPAGAAGGANPSVGLNGSAAPTSSTEIGFIDGSGNEAGVSASNPLPVTVVSGPSPQNVNLTEVGGAAISEGQKTSANSVPVVIASDQSAIPISAASLPLPTGAATAALQSNVQSAPGTPQTEAITVQGNASGVPLPVSGTVAVTAPNDVSPATQNITTQDLVSTSAAQANGQNAITGTPTAGSAASFVIASKESIEVQSTGTWTGTLAIEISMDGGVTWYARGTKQTGSSYIIASATANFEGVLSSAAITNFRVRATAAMTGTATIRIVESLNQGAVAVSNPITLRDSTTQSISNTIKAASTAAVATDTALVVAFSPNSNLVSNAAIGPASPGVAATSSELAGMIYNLNGGGGSSGALPTNGQQLALQSDQYGNLDVVLPDLYVIGQASQTALVNNILTATAGTAATDLLNYRTAIVQVVGTGTFTTGQYIFETSNDNATWVNVVAIQPLTVNGGTNVGANTAGDGGLIYIIPLSGRYLRCRINVGITGGGSIQAFSKFSQSVYIPSSQVISQMTPNDLWMTIGGGAVITEPIIPTDIGDITSAAITTTTTTGTITPGYGLSYNVIVDVTAVSGTNPTMDVVIQETSDLGTNWYSVYEFPLITATGSYVSPVLPLTGGRIRYVQTIAGTTPSFTRSIARNQGSLAVPVYREIIDRTIVPSTTNSTTATLATNGASNHTMIVNQGTGGSAVTFAMDGSDDNVNWVSAIVTVNGVIGGATPVAVNAPNMAYKFIRGRVVTGVASATISYISLISQGTPIAPTGPGLPALPLSGQTTSTGTAVAISTSSLPLLNGVIVQALAGNSGNVYVGATGVTTSNGFQLQPGQATSLAVNNLNVVFVIAATSGDGVCYLGS